MKRILVIRLSSLGDIVLTTPVYRNLKEAWPTCQISVLVKERFVDVLQGHPAVDEILPWRSQAGIWRQLWMLRQQRFDIVIDLHGTVRSWLISLGAGASERVRYRKASWARRALVWWKRRPPVLARHTVDRYLDALRPLGLTPRRYPPDLIGGDSRGGGSRGCIAGASVAELSFRGGFPSNPQGAADVGTSPFNSRRFPRRPFLAPCKDGLLGTTPGGVGWPRRPEEVVLGSSCSREDRRGDLKRLAMTTRVSPRDSPSCPPPPKRVLIVQTAFLGDAVLTTPLVRAVKEAFPQALVIVSCTPETAEVFRGASGVTALVIDDKRGGGTERRWRARGPWGFWRMVRRLRILSCDVALLPHRSIRTALLVWLAGIPRRIGFETGSGRWWYTDQVPFLWGEHDIHRNLRLLDPLGVRPMRGMSRATSPHLSAGTSSETAVQDLCEHYGIQTEDLVIGIAPGSLWATKRWLPERYAAVADALVHEYQARVLLFGAETDREAVRSVRQAMRSPCLDLAGRTSLTQLMALIARCRLFLSNDSGAMHIAAATGVPTIALFGPTTQELGFTPYGEEHIVVERELPCRPCSLHGGARCPEGHFQCMRGISVEEVLAAAHAKLRRVLVPS